MSSVVFYYDISCPFAYNASQRITSIAAKYNATVLCTETQKERKRKEKEKKKYIYIYIYIIKISQKSKGLPFYLGAFIS